MFVHPITFLGLGGITLSAVPANDRRRLAGTDRVKSSTYQAALVPLRQSQMQLIELSWPSPAKSEGLRKRLYMRPALSKLSGMTLRAWPVAFVALAVWPQVMRPAAAGAVPIRSAAALQIEAWDTDRGLPQNSVTAIVQTRDGYLWFGTGNGLVRFDGVRFDVYDENNTPELGSSHIVCLLEDMNGNLWVGTKTAGVVCINNNGRVTSLGLGQGASDKHLAAACADGTGGVWLYLADGQLWHAERDRFVPFVFGMGQLGKRRTIIAEAEGPVWIGTDNLLAAIKSQGTEGGLEPVTEHETRLTRLDLLLASRNGGHWRLANGRVQLWHGRELQTDYGGYPWSRVPIAAACEDAQGRIVVGTLGAGVFWLEPEGGFARISTSEGLSHDIILSLCTDREGNLWVGTDGGGLNRIRRRAFDRPAQLRELPVPVITSVSEDAGGGVWIGSNGGGVVRWAGNATETFGYARGLTNSHVWSVFVDTNQRVWVGTWGGGLFMLESEGFVRAPGSDALDQAVLAIHQDRRGNLWVGTQNGIASWNGNHWRSYTTGDGLSAPEVRAIADDGQGNLWIGTVGGGLNRFRDGVFTVFRRADGLPSDDISSLYVDKSGIVWIGTFGSGLGRLASGRFTRYTTRDGLAANSIGSILEDNQAHLWVCSRGGIMRIAKQQLNDFADGRLRTLHCRTYGKPDGLPTRECTIGSQPGACFTAGERAWFATVKGIATTVPSELTPNPHPPPVVIQSILIDGRSPVPQGVRPAIPSPLVIPPRSERLEIHFTSLNLGAPDRALFRYRLESHEKNWTEPETTRSVTYTRLPPGEYRFQVTACNEDGLWNEDGATLAIIVQPPFWRTWWFITSATIVLLALITGTVHYLSTQRLNRQLNALRQQEALEQERARIARDLHDQLGASLTQVALLGELVEGDKDQPDEVGSHAQQISQTARETTRVLDEIVWAVNPAYDTLDGLANYLCKYTQEYLAVAGLRCRIAVPSSLEPIPIPPDLRHNVFLAAKEAVTNIVRHAQATEAHFRLRVERESFMVEIEDDGRGMPDLDAVTAKNRHGLGNMRRRVEDSGGDFTICARQGGGTIVRFKLPLPSPGSRAATSRRPRNS